MNMTMSVGRDYRTSTKYEYVIYAGENVVAREGFYSTYAAARRAGMKKAAELKTPATRPGDAAAIFAEETGIDYSRALVMCNMD